MNMQKLLMCRMCLVANVNMYVVANKKLQEMYEKLTDVPLVTEDRRPILVCLFCCSKLKQCCRLQTQCLEAEKLFAQMLKEDFETKLQHNQYQLEFSGYTVSPTVHVSISDECQTERDAIKEELPDVLEGQDYASQSESDDIIENEHEDNEPPQHCESDSEDDVLLMKLKTEVEEEQEVSNTKRKANDTKRASVAKKTKVAIRRPKIEDTITGQQKKTEQPYSNNTKPKVNNTVVKTNCHDNSTQRMDSVNASMLRNLSIKETPYKCDICERSFNKKSNLSMHIREHTGDNKPYKCKICQHSFTEKVAFTRHIRVHTRDKRYKCDICQRSFSYKANLSVHIRVHTGDKPYKCEICPLSFTQKINLTKHIRAHTGDKPYKCDICQRCFSSKCDLTRHIHVHTGHKPYKCEICQRSFARKFNLTMHIRVHTGDKPYKCDICHRSFLDKTNLSKHSRVHTDDKPYKCDICERSFNKKSNLTRHIRVHTG